MPLEILDDDNLRNFPPKERLDRCRHILKNEKDESKRWDAVYLAGEIAVEAGLQDPIFDEVADLMSWILKNDENGVVKHEVCFQIAARNMRKKIPDLINTALNDKSGLAKHEAIECLSLMKAFEATEAITKVLDDSMPYVRETAAFALKRLKRLENTGEYNPSKIL